MVMENAIAFAKSSSIEKLITRGHDSYFLSIQFFKVKLDFSIILRQFF